MDPNTKENSLYPKTSFTTFGYSADGKESPAAIKAKTDKSCVNTTTKPITPPTPKIFEQQDEAVASCSSSEETGQLAESTPLMEGATGITPAMEEEDDYEESDRDALLTTSCPEPETQRYFFKGEMKEEKPKPRPSRWSFWWRSRGFDVNSQQPPAVYKTQYVIVKKKFDMDVKPKP